MSDSDKIRTEFEKWAEASIYSLATWPVWQAAYQAGQKAEREAVFANVAVMAAEIERLRAELEQFYN